MLFGRYNYTLFVCLAVPRVRTRHLQLGFTASPGLLRFPADLLIPLDTQQQPPIGQAQGIHVCTWILLYRRRTERSSMETCNDPSLHALALILPRRGGLVASNDAARRDRVLDYCCYYCYLQS